MHKAAAGAPRRSPTGQHLAEVLAVPAGRALGVRRMEVSHSPMLARQGLKT